MEAGKRLPAVTGKLSSDDHRLSSYNFNINSRSLYETCISIIMMKGGLFVCTCVCLSVTSTGVGKVELHSIFENASVKHEGYKATKSSPAGLT